MSKQNEIIMFDSDDAAKYVENIKGWVSRNGLFFGDRDNSEHIARYVGCTHRPCQDCGNPAPKILLVCQDCSEKRDFDSYNKYPVEEWDGETLLYSEWADKYFSDYEEISDYLFELEDKVSISDLRLVICEPVRMREIDSEHWVDDFCDEWDGDLPSEVQDALDNLNEAIRKNGPVSWYPGKRAAKVNL